MSFSEVMAGYYLVVMVVLGACVGGLLFWIGYRVFEAVRPPRSFVVRVRSARRWTDLEPVVADMGKALQRDHTAALAAEMGIDEAVTWSWRLRVLESFQEAVRDSGWTTKAEAWLLAGELAVEIDRMRAEPSSASRPAGRPALAART